MRERRQRRRRAVDDPRSVRYSTIACASFSANSYDTSRSLRSSIVTEIAPFGIGKRSPKRLRRSDQQKLWISSNGLPTEFSASSDACASR